MIRSTNITLHPYDIETNKFPIQSTETIVRREPSSQSSCQLKVVNERGQQTANNVQDKRNYGNKFGALNPRCPQNPHQTSTPRNYIHCRSQESTSRSVICVTKEKDSFSIKKSVTLYNIGNFKLTSGRNLEPWQMVSKGVRQPFNE